MPLLFDTTRPAPRAPGRTSGASQAGAYRSRPAATGTIEVGLVNNMPDGALEQTEWQFRTLLDAAAGSAPVRLRLFSLPGIPRGERARAHLEATYAEIDEIWDGNLAALIVTGTEPRSPELRNEPYWHSLADLLDWAELNGLPVVLSCLAAHAGVLHADGIIRRALPEKRFGVFAHEVAAPHVLTRGLAAPFGVPHSRWHDLPEDALADCGYRILTRSAQGGVDMFVRQRRNLLVCFQGHAEYDAGTLLREYKRDVRRFLAGASERYPAPPAGLFDQATTEQLAAFRERALLSRREALISDFPIVSGPGEPPWRAVAVAIWRNLLSYIREQDI